MQIQSSRFLKAFWEWRTLFVLLLILSFFTGLIVGGMQLRYHYSSMTVQQEQQIKEIQEASRLVANLSRVYDYGAVEVVGQTLLSRPGILEIKIFELPEFVIFSSRRDEIDHAYDTKKLQIELLDAEDNQFGLMEVIVDKPNRISIWINSVINGTLAFVIIFLTSAYLTSLYLLRFVISPLNKLALAIDETVRTGDPVKAAPVNQSGFGRFAKQFNQMQEKLADVNRRLEVQRDRVELHSDVLVQVLGSISQLVRYYPHIGEYKDFHLQRELEEFQKILPDHVVIDHEKFIDWISDRSEVKTNYIQHNEDSHQFNLIYEVEVRFKDRGVFNYKLVKLPSHGYAMILADVSEAKKLEQSLIRAQKMEAVGLLTSGIAHDFNNILAIISTNLELAMMKSPDNQNVLNNLDVAFSATQRGASTISSLLSFSRRWGQYDENVDISAVIKDVIVIIQHTIGSNFEIRFEDELNQEAYGPYSQLDSALINLIINARDAMESGGVININLKMADDELLSNYGLSTTASSVLLSVSDHGTGIPDEMMSEIKKPFVTTKDEFSGTGLGLSMIDEFTRKHNGILDFKNNDDRGATFFMILPCNGDFQKSVDEIADAEFLDAGEKNKQTTILIVEDELDFLDVLNDALAAHNFNVICAESISSAQRLLEEVDRLPDLIFTDLNLKDGNGSELLNYAEMNGKNVPIILMSGNMEHGKHTDLNEEKFFSVLYKPFSIKRLLDSVSSALN